MEALKDLFIINDLEAWNPNLRSKAIIISTPTRYFVDTSVPAYCGTWSGKVGLNDVTIVINSDGTTTYGGIAADSNYTVNGNVIKFTYGDESYSVTITYNESSKSITVVWYDEYEYIELEGTMTEFTPEAN